MTLTLQWKVKNMEKRYLNVSEIAGYLGFSISVVRKWVRQRSIPYNKVDGGVLFDIERINQWLEKERIDSYSHYN